MGYLRRAHGPGWALVGDASSFKDPLTNHGITDALRDAELLARALTGADAGGLPAYQRARDDFALPILRVGERIASFAWALAELQALHHALNREMNRELDHLSGLTATYLAA